MRVERGAQRRAGVARGGLDEDLLDVGALEELAVGERVQGAAARERQPPAAARRQRAADEGEEALLVDLLQRRRHVAVPLLELVARLPARPEQRLELGREQNAQLWRAVLPRHLHAGVEVAEVTQVETERAVVHRAHDLAQLADEAGLAVGREPHHLVFVAEAEEAEVLRDGGVENPQRVREEDAVEHLDAIAAAARQHRRHEVAEAVDGEQRRLLERRAEEGGGEVREVVLDGNERRAARAWQLEPHALLKVADLHEIARTAGGAAEALRVRQRQPDSSTNRRAVVAPPLRRRYQRRRRPRARRRPSATLRRESPPSA